MIQNKLSCPNCDEKHSIYFRLNWNKRFYDFSCGKCRLDLIIPNKFIGNPNAIIKAIFDFKYLDEIRDRVNNMTYEEKLDRLKELEEKKK